MLVRAAVSLKQEGRQRPQIVVTQIQRRQFRQTAEHQPVRLVAIGRDVGRDNGIIQILQPVAAQIQHLQGRQTGKAFHWQPDQPDTAHAQCLQAGTGAANNPRLQLDRQRVAGDAIQIQRVQCRQTGEINPASG